jgi:hypothetical protein
MSRYTPQEVDEIILTSRRLVEQAEQMLANSHRKLAECGLDPEAYVEQLRRHGGEAAVAAFMDEVERTKRDIEAEVASQRMHAPVGGSASRKAALHRGRI